MRGGLHLRAQAGCSTRRHGEHTIALKTIPPTAVGIWHLVANTC